PPLSFILFPYTTLFRSNIQNTVIVVGLGFLWLRTRGAWRLVYAGLFGGAALQMTASLFINVGINLKTYKTGTWFDLPMLASFLRSEEHTSELQSRFDLV